VHKVERDKKHFRAAIKGALWENSMIEVADIMDIGASQPWQWHVGAFLCWAIVFCLCLLFVNPETRT